MVHTHLWLKLTAAFAVVVVVTAVTTVWLTSSGTATQFEHIMVGNQMVRPARLQQALADHYTHHQGWAALDDMLDRLVATVSDGGMAGMMGSMMGMHENRLQVVDDGGRVVADTGGPPGTQPRAAPPLETWPIVVDGETVGTLLVAGSLMGAATSDSSLLVGSVTRTVLYAALVAGVAALLMAAAIAHQITRPLMNLTQAARRVAAGDLGVRVPLEGRDEVGELAASFNHMAGSLEEQELLRRHLMADIAHELRTPLTGIQGAVEAMQDGVFPADMENLNYLHEEVLLLNRLVDDLRTLANAEAGQLTLELEQVDLVDLCRRQVLACQHIAAARSITIGFVPEGDIPSVPGDSQRLAQVVRNLLDNALRHTPDGGRVTVGSRARGNRVEVAVSDTGDGIPSLDLPHVFDRFYRADPSRSRVTGGSGLGLAIARQLVAAHGGTIAVASPVPGMDRGALFAVALPLTMPAGTSVRR
jgi:signal transduction histidine kinase